MCIYFIIIIIGQLLNTKKQEAFQKKKIICTWFLYCFVAYLICMEHLKFVENLTIVLSTFQPRRLSPKGTQDVVVPQLSLIHISSPRDA